MEHFAHCDFCAVGLGVGRPGAGEGALHLRRWQALRQKAAWRVPSTVDAAMWLCQACALFVYSCLGNTPLLLLKGWWLVSGFYCRA